MKLSLSTYNILDKEHHEPRHPHSTHEKEIMSLASWSRTSAPAAVVLIRILVATVFFSEGVQKFLFPAALGAGRFARIGIPHAHQFAPLVGAVEVTCSVLILLGLFTRLAAIPLLAVISVAIWTTKIPLLHQGFWAAAHEARTDWSMLLSLLFLLIVGAGSLSVDGNLRG
ncbi:MAG TPA: DoxX family protein [Acidisarcina sp.]|nr:DoxX family protein [Acidisarcina sp.]